MTSTSIKIGVFVLFATILIFQTAMSSAQSAIPENAYATNSNYVKKWKCLRGFREQGSTCTRIAVPDNAFLRSSGDGWECNRGYQKRNNQCVNIDVPENAFLTGRTYGAGWECERGFMADNKGCNKITIPPNAYLSETGYGTGWKCERGFQAKGNGCEPITLPQNAHIGYSGNDWECSQPYRRVGKMCQAR